MTSRRNQPSEVPADLPPVKAHSVLKAQLSKLQELKGRNYQEAEAAEQEWFNLTEKLVLRSFGSGSRNYSNFRGAPGQRESITWCLTAAAFRTH